MRKIPDFEPVKMNFGHIYVYGAAAGNTTNHIWDIVKVYASIYQIKHNPEDIKCCFLYKFQNHSDMIAAPVLHKTQHWAPTKMRTFHFTCRNIWHNNRDIPDGVGLLSKKIPCKKDTVAFKDIYKPLKDDDTTLVLTTQVVYANISAELIIEWMEVYKYLGVDKVISYYFRDLNQQALQALQYYNRSGLVDLYQFIPAAEGK